MVERGKAEEGGSFGTSRHLSPINETDQAHLPHRFPYFSPIGGNLQLPKDRLKTGKIVAFAWATTCQILVSGKPPPKIEYDFHHHQEMDNNITYGRCRRSGARPGEPEEERGGGVVFHAALIIERERASAYHMMSIRRKEEDDGDHHRENNDKHGCGWESDRLP